MFPLKDDIPTRRFPAVTTALIVIGLVGCAGAIAGLHAGNHVWSLLAGALFLKVFGGTAEDAMGRWRFLAFCALAGLVATGVIVAARPGSADLVVAAGGAVAAVLMAHVALYPRARVVGLTFGPAMFTVVTVNGLAVLAAWPLIQLAIALSPADGGAAAIALGQAGGIAFGLATARMFARHVQEDADHTGVVGVAR